MEQEAMPNQQVHPYAGLFPMLSGRELADLAADIKANGQTNRIVLDQHGRLIDGRNRLRACELAGVEPLTETREFADDAAVLRFVVSANLHRRHLDESQRAMVAAGIANVRREDTLKQNTDGSIDLSAPPITQEHAAEMLNVSVPSVKRAKQVLTHGTPELVEAVQSGEIKVSKAAAIAKKPKEEQKEEMAKAKGKKESQKAKKTDLPKQHKGPPQPGEIKSLGVGIERANEAINCLKRIPKNDALRQRAFKIVRDWMRRNP